MVPVTRRRVEKLAEWRMFSNEAVADVALHRDFSTWSREVATNEIYSTLLSYDLDWFTATDEFYLFQRMQRWAGVLTTAGCLERTVINPMLDNRFLTIVRSLRPQDKYASRFLAKLMCQLDGQLSSAPLNNRPAPRVYAQPFRLRNRASLVSTTARTAAAKLRQMATQTGRPRAGGRIVSAKISDFYRENPQALQPMRNMGIFRSDWLDGVVAGTIVLDPPSAAMLVNLEVAAMQS
jgi:asparagine synthase (glutamine-hydrolysing)